VAFGKRNEEAGNALATEADNFTAMVNWLLPLVLLVALAGSFMLGLYPVRPGYVTGGSGASFVALVWRVKRAEVLAMQSGPIGAAFTFITLVTGSLWGKPMWGTWWTWDARLTSELVLLFLYLGVIGLYHAFEDRRQGARAAGFLAIIGVINVPIVHFSVNWWNTLHQGSTVNVFGQSKMAWDMLWPLLTMTLATKFYYAGSLFRRARTDLLDMEGGKDWVRKIAEDEADR